MISEQSKWEQEVDERIQELDNQVRRLAIVIDRIMKLLEGANR